MADEYAIGVDMGATKILAGVIDCHKGTIVGSAKAPSPTTGASDVMHALLQTVGEALDDAPADVAKHITHIGLGVPGQVDAKKGVLLFAPNLGGGVHDVNLVDQLRSRFNVPVTVGNDLEVAAIGEAKFGAGRGIHLFACVFVGTGIGGALMVDGVRFKGAAGSAGEIGHTVVQAGGRKCGCGQNGHLEAYASRTAIVNMLREEVENGATSSIRDLLLDRSQRIKSKPLAQAVEEGDPLVVNIMTQAAYYLGQGLVNLINLWSPQRVILGGGVIDRIDLLFNLAAEHAKKESLPAPASAVDIVRAELGDYSGMVGAALLGVNNNKP